MLRHRAGTLRDAGDIDPWLDRRHHSWLEKPPFVADPVIADVVHIHPDPVAGTVHEEFPIGFVFDQLCDRAIEQAQCLQPFGDDSNGGIVGIIPVIALHRPLDRRKLRLEDDLVHGSLPPD